VQYDRSCARPTARYRQTHSMFKLISKDQRSTTKGPPCKPRELRSSRRLQGDFQKFSQASSPISRDITEFRPHKGKRAARSCQWSFRTNAMRPHCFVKVPWTNCQGAPGREVYSSVFSGRLRRVYDGTGADKV